MVAVWVSGVAGRPWDWQTARPASYTRFQRYERQLHLLAAAPFFARVNNSSAVQAGELAALPCRVKRLQPGYTVSSGKLSLYLTTYLNLENINK